MSFPVDLHDDGGRDASFYSLCIRSDVDVSNKVIAEPVEVGLGSLYLYNQSPIVSIVVQRRPRALYAGN